MSEEAKKPYYELSKISKDQYTKEMKEFLEKGFFNNKDGVCSKDLLK